MGTELTVLNNNVQLAQGGLGVDFNSKLFELRPANLFIVQNNSNIEGAVKGNLRVAETGDEFKEISGTLLVMPTEQRQYHIGEVGGLNRIPENLVCFSTDLVVPHAKSRIPQAVSCATCARSSWEPWREYKEKNNGQTNKALIPPCDSHYRLLLIEDKYKLPLQMFIRSKAKDPFEAAMQNLARVIAMMRAEGKNPNIFDVKFTMSTKVITTGKFQSFVPVFKDFKPLNEHEREQFGAVYLQYIRQKNKKQEDAAKAEAEEEVSAANESVDSSVVEGEYVGEDQVIPI